MLTFVPPVDDYVFLARYALADLVPTDGPSLEDVQAVLDASSRFASDVMLPLRASGDTQGCLWHDGKVCTPDGFPKAYARYVDGGWPGMDVPAALGGLGMPKHVSIATWEFQGAANPALDMYFGWGASGAAILGEFGSEWQKSVILPRLVDGSWTGSMALTEPQAGSDLGAIRTRAEERGDGYYAVSGAKIYNSGGAHDLTDNVIHFVLANIDGAGPTLIAVPSVKIDADGRPGAANALFCTGIERKMGLHANATCSMSYDGAEGTLVGTPGQGLAIMFRLMNHMRMRTGAIALGASEIALQSASAHADSRIQGRGSNGEKVSLKGHPDVRRILLEIETFNTAARGLLLAGACATEETSPLHEILPLLTPVLKGFVTERALENCLAAQQIFGGYGYVSGSGIEQIVRDARMLTIAEGATAIQANDLLLRKLQRIKPEVLGSLLGRDADSGGHFENAIRLWSSNAHALREDILARRDVAAAVAVAFLDLTGWLFSGWIWSRVARVADSAAQPSRLRDQAQWFVAVRLGAEMSRCSALIAGRAIAVQAATPIAATH